MKDTFGLGVNRVRKESLALIGQVLIWVGMNSSGEMHWVFCYLSLYFGQYLCKEWRVVHLQNGN